MGAALGGGDIVYIRKYAFGITVVMLHGNLDDNAFLARAVDALKIDGLLIERSLIGIEISYKIHKTALVFVFTGPILIPSA